MARWISAVRFLCVAVFACVAVGCSADADSNADDKKPVVIIDAGNADTTAGDDGGSSDTSTPDAGADTSGGQDGQSSVGGACSSADDCAGSPAACFSADDGFPGGYCVVEGCETNDDCPGDASCWSFQDDTTKCLANCTTRSDCREGYYCDADNTCWPGEGCSPGSCATGEVCDEQTGRCEIEPCTPGSCDAGLVCQSGQCVIDVGQPPAGPVPDCSSTISWECDGTPEHCSEVVQFEPITGEGWWNYPLNGETSANQYRSYIRRDTMQLIKYASAKVACKAADWPGNGGLLGLGDMSEANGDIPGTSVGSPGHPQGTHVDGFDMDIAYYQQNTADNKLRPVCDHIDGGQDTYHCTSEPYDLDIWRTALFLAHLHDAVIQGRFQMRVVGVDGKVGPLVVSAIDELCNTDWYTGPACSQKLIAFEETDEGRGWYYFHHHHLHVSTNGLHPDVPVVGPVQSAENACLVPGCSVATKGKP